MAQGEFLNEYRRDVAAFLKTPGDHAPMTMRI